MRTIVLPIDADPSKAESKIKNFASFVARELSRLNSQTSQQSGGDNAFGLSETVFANYRKFSDQLSGVRDRMNQARESAGAFSDAFKGTFLGNLASNAVSAFTNQLAQLPRYLEAAAAKIYGLAQGWADAGSEIHDAGQKIALSAESLSAIKMAADISGSSLQNFTGGFAKFERSLATGGGKVKSTFEQMGIDIAAGAKNPEAAFSQFLTKFNELPDDARRSAVAMQLFGKSGAELIPTFLELGGNFDAAKKKAADLGLVFSQQAADDADKLGDTIDIIKKQAAGLGYQFIGAFAPQISEALGKISAFITANKDVFAVWGKYVGQAIDLISSTVSGLINYFSNLSPETQKVVGVFTLVAGAIGSAVAAIAGISAVIEASAALTALATGVGAASAAFSEILIPLALVGAAAAALYLAWQTNFGGIRDFTLRAWETIKSVTQSAMASVYKQVREIGGEVVAWWNDNYALIERTVKTVSDFIKDNIQSALKAISEFWQAHSEQIKAVVGALWDTLKTIFTVAGQTVGGIIKALMQAINGDWAGMANTVGKIVGQHAGIMQSVFTNLKDGIVSIVTSLFKWLGDNWQKIFFGIGEMAVVGIAKIVKAFADLPVTLITIVPQMVRAGASIAEALWRGFKLALNAQGEIGGTFGNALVKANTGLGEKSAQQTGIFGNLFGGSTSGSKVATGLGETSKSSGLDIDLSDSGGKKGGKDEADLKKILDQYFIGKKMGIGDGLELRKNLESLLNSPQTKLFLETVKIAEGGAPNLMAGGRKVSNLDTHPGNQVPRSQWFLGPKGRSSASGNWQETLTNWEEIAPMLGLKDFSVKNQAIAALEIMRRQSPKGFIELAKGNLEGAFTKGTQPWASSSFSTLPGGKKDYLKIARNINGGKGLESGLELEIAASDKQLKILQDIAETRVYINQLVTIGGNGNQKQLDALNTQKSNLEEIGKLVEQINNSGLNQQLVVGLPDSPEEAAKMVERLKAVTDLQKTVSTGNDAAKEKIFALSQATGEGLSDLEKFDYGLQQLRASGTLTAADFALLADGIDDYRQNLKKASELEAAQKIAADAKAVSESLSGMTENFRQQFAELGQTDSFKPFAGFLDQIRQIKELDLPVEAFDEFKTAISPDGVDTEKLAQIARFWLTLSATIGGTDPAKIDELVSKLTLSAKSFNDLNAAQKAAKNADDFKSLSDGLGGEYEDLLRNGREVSTYEKTLRDLETTYKGLSQAEKDNLLAKAEQIDAVRSAQENYAKLRSVVGESVNAFADGGFKGLFKSIKDRFKSFLVEMFTDWITSKIFGVLSGRNIGGTQNNASSTGGGFLGGILGNIKGILGGGSNVFGGGNQGKGVFSFANGQTGAAGSNLPTGSLVNLPNGDQAYNVNGNQSANPLSSLLSGKGVSSALATGGLTAGLALLQYSLRTTSPIKGLLTGGLVGLVAGFINRSRERRKEEVQRTEFLNSAIGQLGDFDKLIADVKALRISPPSSALVTGDALSKQIHDGYLASANTLKDSKTRKIALSELTKIGGIDSQIAQKMSALRAAVSGANEAAEFKDKFVATFATGGYMDGAFHNQYRDFKRRNGFLTGGTSGVDSLPSLLMPGEIVVNQIQQNRIRQIAGADVFAHAEIPNYPVKPTLKPVKLASGGAIGTVSLPSVISNNQSSNNQSGAPVFNLVLQGVIALPDAKAYLESPDGKRQVVSITKEHIQNNPITGDGIARDLKKAGV